MRPRLCPEVVNAAMAVAAAAVLVVVAAVDVAKDCAWHRGRECGRRYCCCRVCGMDVNEDVVPAKVMAEAVPGVVVVIVKVAKNMAGVVDVALAVEFAIVVVAVALAVNVDRDVDVDVAVVEAVPGGRGRGWAVAVIVAAPSHL